MAIQCFDTQWFWQGARAQTVRVIHYKVVSWAIMKKILELKRNKSFVTPAYYTN